MAEERQRKGRDRRQGPVRNGEDRRKISIPPPPGSPVRSGLDRRGTDRRSGQERRKAV
jgi:hypothetical protein